MANRVAAALICLTLLQAQSPVGTAEGVAAFNRGDYQQAAAILGPIAEEFPSHDDYTAQWFMAQMYETGRGVPQDRVRACALFHRVLRFDWTSPGAETVIERARDAYFALERPLANRCQLLSNLGLRHGFQDVTVDLGPGHWVHLELDLAIVGYEGVETRVAFPDWPPGTVFLPSVHTELTGRHFIEIASWRVDQRQQWTLIWDVFEIVRAEWLHVASETLETTRADGVQRSLDVHDLAQLRDDGAANVDLVLLTGSQPQYHHIESAMEREERLARERARLERERARDAAERRIDWSLRRDLGRRPALQYADAFGCVNISVYAWSSDRTEVIALHADGQSLQLSPTPQTFDLAAQRPGLELMVHVYDRPTRSSWLPFCTDVVPTQPLPEERWRAAGGTVTITVAPAKDEDGESILRATVRIVGARFVRDDGVQVAQVEPIVLTARVGRFFG